MGLADGNGLPVGAHLEAASPHEVTLVQDTLGQTLGKEKPEHLIGDKAYDSDPLDEQLAQQGIEMIAPNRSNRKQKTQDSRPLRRYRKRWKVERLFVWLQNFRRIVVRWEIKSQNYLGFLHLAIMLILLRQF